MFEDGYPGQKETIIEKLKEFEEKTCVKLELADNELARGGLLIKDNGNGGCFSGIGRQNPAVNSVQNIQMQANYCEAGNTPLHEVMHALGFWHEQQRPDRDEFVTIHPDLLIDNGNYIRLDKLGSKKGWGFWLPETGGTGFNWDELDPKSEYDFSSIMHYPGKSHDDGTPTIARVENPSEPFPLYIPTTFSEQDLVQINHAYPCGNNECKDKNRKKECDIKADCVNDSDGYHCLCSPGYVGDGFINNCKDIDECDLGTDNCQPDEICYNTQGSFGCRTLVDECSLETHDCHENASCTNTDEFFTCSCNDGFFGDGKICSGENIF